MVTAKTQYSLSNALGYFREHLAIGDYYQEGQKIAGEWYGIGARSLGLEGRIREPDFLALCENQRPDGDGCLTQRTNSVRRKAGSAEANRRIFYDFTFSPPKSVSIAALIGEDKRILAAHDRAIRVALGEFETFAADSNEIGHLFRFHPDTIPADVGQRSGVCRTVSRSEATRGFAKYSARFRQSSSRFMLSEGRSVPGTSRGQEDRSPMGVAPLLTEASSL